MSTNNNNSKVRTKQESSIDGHHQHSNSHHHGNWDNLSNTHNGVAGNWKRTQNSSIDSNSMNTKFLYNVIMNGTKNKVKRDSFTRGKSKV